MVLAPVVNAASTVIVPPVTLGYGVGVTAKTGDRIKKHATPAKNKTYALFKKRFIVLLFRTLYFYIRAFIQTMIISVRFGTLFSLNISIVITDAQGVAGVRPRSGRTGRGSWSGSRSRSDSGSESAGWRRSCIFITSRSAIFLSYGLSCLSGISGISPNADIKTDIRKKNENTCSDKNHFLLRGERTEKGWGNGRILFHIFSIFSLVS